jgi:hypothetical protein
MRSARTSLRHRAWRLRAAAPGARPPRLPAWSGPATSLPPIIIGGTGRSGTTVTARLLGAHPDYHAIPFEVRFLGAPGGLCDVVEGRTTIMAFERLMLGKWFDRGPAYGLKVIADRPTIRAAILELDAGLRHEPRQAARRFVHRLLDPVAIAAGKRGWIEMSPDTMLAAGELAQILPAARLIHAVRDGRDVACSVTMRDWGPSEREAALDWWARRLGRAYEATSAVPVDRMLTLRMESLLLFDREAEYRRLREFTGLADDPALRAYFDAKATSDRTHVGRWRQDVPPADQAAFEARYRALAAPLVERWGYEADLAGDQGRGVADEPASTDGAGV